MNDEMAGGCQNPIDLSLLNIQLADVSLICMLLDDDEHESVMSLTEETVERLDKTAKILQLDEGFASYRYFGRSRLNDQTGNSIRCKLHFNAVFADKEDSHYP